jgi:hypothetical protein
MKDEPDIIEMEQLFPSEPESSERILFLSVILQALLDATKEKKENVKVRITYERDRAKSWLFAKVGVTCENFEEVCDMAGVSPSATRTFAYQVVHSHDKDFIRKRIQNILGDKDNE